MSSRLPVAVVGGFLGAGKTTLINTLLSRQTTTRTAVIVNEFGSLGIDGQLIRSAKGGVIELTNGCVCCEVREDLSEAVRRLLAQRQRWIRPLKFDRLWIELSGVASPGPVVQTFRVQPDLVQACQWRGLIAVANAGILLDQIERYVEARQQIIVADMVVLNHCDETSDADIVRAERAIQALNPFAVLRRTTYADIDEKLLWQSMSDTRSWTREIPAEPHGHSDLQTLSFEHSVPLSLHTLKIFLQFLSSRNANRIVRMKGIFHCADHTSAIVVNGVHQWLELGPVETPAPSNSQFVIIGHDLDEEEIRRGWGSVTD